MHKIIHGIHSQIYNLNGAFMRFKSAMPFWLATLPPWGFGRHYLCFSTKLRHKHDRCYTPVHNKHTTKELVCEEDVKNSLPGSYDTPPQMGDHLELHTWGRG